MRKKKKLIVIVSIIIILLAVGSVVGSKLLLKKPVNKDDRIEIVRRGPLIVKLNERGSLDSLVKVAVRSNVEGEIDKLYVNEGYDVVKGQQLLKIDEEQIREEYNQAKANFNAAQAEVERSKENARLNMDRLKSDILLAKTPLLPQDQALKAQRRNPPNNYLRQTYLSLIQKIYLSKTKYR